MCYCYKIMIFHLIFTNLYILYLFFNHNAHKDINITKCWCRARNVMCIIKCVLICNCVYVFLCLYVYVYVLCYATFVFQGLHVVLFINKVTCPIYIYKITLTFESIYKDIIYINIVTVNGCLKRTILNVNEYLIKMICNKKLNLREYRKNNLIIKLKAIKIR